MGDASNGGSSVDDLTHYMRATSLLDRKLRIAEQALRDITRCDYRGNEPPEQMIARLALAEMERERGL